MIPLPFWTVDDGCIVTTTGALFRCAEVRGLDPDCTPIGTWEAAQSGLRDGLRRMPDEVLLQFILERSAARLDPSAPDGTCETTSREGIAGVLAHQRAERHRFLDARNLRCHRTYVVYGYRWGLSREEFSKVSPEAHNRQRERLAELEEYVLSVLQRGHIRARVLGDPELWSLLARQVRPERTGEFRPRAGSVVQGMSPREELLDSDIVWADDHVRIGDHYTQVLAAKALPSATDPTIWTRLIEAAPLDFDHRIVVHMTFPSRRFAKWLYTIGTRIAETLAQKKPNQAQDPKGRAAQRDMDAVADAVVAGERLVTVGIQGVVWAPTLPEVHRRARSLRNAFGAIDVILYPESVCHHTEMPKSVAGMGSQFDRWRLVTSEVAADLVPNETYSVGDPAPTVVFERPHTRTPYGIAIVDTRSAEGEKARPNDNFLVLGSPGSGKTVLVNLLIAYGALSGRTRGRIIAVDHAGPDKSSFRVAAEIFGGQYICVQGGAKFNPLPSPHEACIRGTSDLTPEALGRILDVANVLLLTSEPTKEDAAHRGVLQLAVKRLYERWAETRAPIYSDLYEVLRDVPCDTAAREQRRATLCEVMETFLSGPAAAVLNHRTTVPTDGEFLVYDLFGVTNGLAPHEQQAVVRAVTHLVRSMSFDGHAERRKYLIFDEAAQLMDVGMSPTMLEMLRAARAHGCAVGIISQVYEEFRASGIVEVVRSTTAAQYYMSHTRDTESMNQIATDFGFNEREREVFRTVRAVPGRYAEAFVRSTVQIPGAEPEQIGAKARLYLSPYDEQLVTSSADDRAQQQALLASEPTATRAQVLAYLAQRKHRVQTKRRSVA